ncbi:MAG: Zn-dependent oligopeptidase [Planctomycetes bacterium]|nr:Zn-dependent oligopeptidase [Planctomycetota bacterium]
MSRTSSALRRLAAGAVLSSLALGCQVPTAHAQDGDLVAANLAATPLDRAPGQLTADVAEHLANAQALREQILSVDGARTIENTLRPLDRIYLEVDAADNDCGLFEEVHPYDAMREAASAARQDISAFATDLSLDRGVYDAIAAVDLSGADDGLRYAVEKELLDYRLAGVDKDDATRKRIVELNDEILKLSQDYQQRLAADVRSIALDSVDDLAGLPDDYIAKHKPDADGKIHIDTTYPDYIPFQRYAKSGAARKALYLEYQNRAYPDNVTTLEKLIAARYEKAQLLGFPDFAAYITADKMIGSEEAAAAFIDKVADVARAPAKRDYAMLLAAKRRDQPDATQVTDYEKTYYGDLVKQQQFDFDSQSARPYFEFSAVQQGIFDLTSKLFGVRIVPVEGLVLWHPDVTAWDMFDADGSQVGRFYLDLHPRDNKYGHAACFPYRNGVEGVQLPQATLVCNFPDPKKAEDGVALMDFGDVNTFLHEFGHLLHHLFAGHQEWAMNAGISNEWDFVEAPSQLLEEWLLDTETLQSFAKHYQTGEPIPAEMVERIRASSEFGKGIDASHQAFYAAVSLHCYDRAPPFDTDALVTQLQDRYSAFKHVDGAHMQASFGHLVGYSAIYYTYKWSEVIAKDLFSKFEQDGVLNVDTARLYREKVLEPGSSKPAAELVKDFLGRDYSFEAYRRWLERAPEPRG